MMASSSRRLMLLFLRPVDLDSKTAWVVSGFSMLVTTRVEEEKNARVSRFQNDAHLFRVRRLTDDGLQDGLRAFDELVVNLVDQVTQNLPVLRQLKMGETLLILLGGVVFSDGLRRDGITSGPFLRFTRATARLASNPQPLYLLSAVLLQTVPQSARVGQPVGQHLKLLSSPLQEKVQIQWRLAARRHRSLFTRHLDDAFDAADG